MAYGFTIYNATHGRIQVEQDYANPRLLSSGSAVAGSVQIGLPYSITQECPLVLIRPSVADLFVGGSLLRSSAWDPAYPNGFVGLRGQCAFDWAIFSTRGSSVSDGSAWGLEVYQAGGSLAFSSRFQYPRLTHLVNKPANGTSGGGWPFNMGISGFSSMPWLLANPLCMTAAGVSGESEQMGAIMASVNSSFTNVTVDFRDGAYELGTNRSLWYRPFPALTDRANYNPYSAKPAWFGAGNVN